ncbi:ribonuclease III [Chitinasiproducens palmae]|uniref:Ribonuclease 3 n=1 Tax=Chitinasiproducens palmae TaxID=1770053 RepID=A0A1H2PUU6_9BURK|nr:ribonuclease-3 [Chitinasiproducens palmae]
MATHALEKRLGYTFGDAGLLARALTHRSHGANHNERLEFLGDSVLNCAVAAMLYRRFGDLDEGTLSRVRAGLVRQETLHEHALRLSLSDALLLGEGELRSGGAHRPSILADALEAVIGAVYLDGGFDAASAVLERLYLPLLDRVDTSARGKDAKTRLQEHLQGRRLALPTYTLLATVGAAHDQAFEVSCSVPALDVTANGRGTSRRAAEQEAAAAVLQRLAPADSLPDAAATVATAASAAAPTAGATASPARSQRAPRPTLRRKERAPSEARRDAADRSGDGDEA